MLLQLPPDILSLLFQSSTLAGMSVCKRVRAALLDSGTLSLRISRALPLYADALSCREVASALRRLRDVRLRLDVGALSVEDAVLRLTGERGISDKLRVYEARSDMRDALETARSHDVVRQAVEGVLGEGGLTRLVALRVSAECHTPHLVAAVRASRGALEEVSLLLHPADADEMRGALLACPKLGACTLFRADHRQPEGDCSRGRFTRMAVLLQAGRTLAETGDSHAAPGSPGG